MAFRFRSVIPYAIPGVLALLGCWWMYSHRKKYASYHDEQAIAAEEEQQEEVPENDSSPKTEACVPQEGTSDEEYPENETSTSLLSAGSTPSLLCQTHERPDLSQDLPDLSVMTVQPSTFEDDSEKLETMKTQDESSVPACVSLPLISKSTECHSSAAVSLIQDSSSSANQDQWPSASVTLTQKSLGITEISNAEQSDDSSFKPPEESQMPEIVAGSVTALCLGLEKEDKTPQAFLNIEVVSSHKDSAVSMLPDSLESACLEQSREEDMSESIASTVPVCQEDTQPKGDELEREKIGGVSLDKEEVEKIEQVAIQIISKVIFAATEEVLSGSAGDVSTQTCQAAASQVERPLETASVVSPAQMLAEEATVADENIAAKGDAAVLTSPQTEEQDQSVTDSSCLTDSCLSGPVQGDTEDCQVKNRVCSEEVLAGSAGDVSTRTCRAAASQVERPLETASVVSPAQMLAEEATVADENIAAKGDAAVLTSPQSEEQGQSVTDSSCSTDSCLSGPVQGDTKDRQVKNRVCSEEVLSGSAGDVSTQTCQAAASQVERPLETASVVSPAQMLAEEATVADENIAAKGDAAVLTSPQTEEQDQSVTDSSCLTDSCLSGPVQGDTEDCQVKNRVCSEEVLAGSAGDVSTRTCRAAASQVERPLETASVVSPAQMLAEEATVADENIAAKGDAAVLTSPQSEEQGQSVTDSSCSTDSCLSGPVQGDTKDRQVKNRVCSEEVLSGSAGDVSTQTCQAAASQVERPLETASVVSPAQMLAEEATVADENIAAKGDAAVLTSPQTEEQDQSVTDSSCLTDSCLSGPVQGDTEDCQVKNRVCSEEVLAGSAGDVSTRTCRAAASQVERPLETASVVSPAQMLAEEATVADENIAAKGDAAVLTSPQSEEQGQSVTDSSCSTDSCLSGPVQGDTKDRQVKNRVCSEEVLSGSAGDVSTQTCQAAASQVERPLETASVVSPAQMLAEEATVADENIAAKGDAAVLTSPQTEEQDQSVTDSSCLTDSCLSGPVQGDTEDRQVKNRVCSEEVLAGSAGDVSTRTCRAAASQVERPLETASVVSPAQMLAEEATVADENIAAKGDAAVLTTPQSEEQDQSVTDSSCLTDSCLSGPVQGDTKDRQVKNRVCSESQGVDRTPVENHGGSLEKSPVVMEDFGCNTYTSEGGTSVEDSLQNTMLSVTSGQRSDSLSISATQDTSAEQTSVPSEKPPTLKLPEDSKVPYTNGILKDDGPDLRHECSRAAQMDGDHSGGLDANSMDFMDSGCAMRKTVTHQNCKLGGESSKSDFVIWEVEVPKELVGRLIGKQGRYMSFLRQASGAKIYVSTLPYFRDSQVCHIEGSPQQVEKVLSLIGQKFKELCLTNIYALPPPTPLTLHSLLMTAWLFLPDGVTVEVVVANQVDAGHMFLQQHTHPTFHVLRSLDQQMYACYSQPEIPTLPTPVEVGIICAAPGLDGAWLRAQVISYFEETNEVELRYVDYGGYDKVKIDTLRQIRSDFLSLPFQGAEVLLDNVVPLPDEDHFSSEADAAVSEMTTGAVLVAQVTNYDSATGLPLIQLWNLMGDEVVSINRTLVERGFAQWLDY